MSKGEWFQIAMISVSLVILMSSWLPMREDPPVQPPAPKALIVKVPPKPVRTPEPPLAALDVSALRAELIAEGILSHPPKPVRPRVPPGPFDPAACPKFRFVEAKDSPSIFPDGYWTPVLDMWVTGVSESHECWMLRACAQGWEWCDR